MTNEPFADNPFRHLGKFPDWQSRAEGGRHPKKRTEQTPEDLADSELFLNALGAVRPMKDAGAKDTLHADDDLFMALSAHGAFEKMKQTSPAEKKAQKKAARKALVQSAPAKSPSVSARLPLSDAQLFAAALAHEEQEETHDTAFAVAMQSVTPLQGKGRDIPPLPDLAKAPAVPNPLRDFMEGKLEFTLAFTDEYLEGHVVGLDELTMNKLRAGNYSPEAHLDLHGLNAMQAYQAMLGFFRNAYHRNLRSVLVVPGRGLNSPNGWGILRDKVQDWLTQDPFKRVVLAFCTAQPCDGGPGSMYVLLRKFKKSRGKICWERMPLDSDLRND